MRWRDVDWEGRRITVRGTKTASSFRTVDLGDLAMTLLQEHRRHELEKRLSLGPGANCGSDDATIFTNIVGKPMDAGGLKRTWKRIIRDAAVGHVRFHDLRHASATFMHPGRCAHPDGQPAPGPLTHLDHHGHLRSRAAGDGQARGGGARQSYGRLTMPCLTTSSPNRHMVNRWSKAHEVEQKGVTAWTAWYEMGLGKWRARRDSNPRHLVPKTSALSTELRAPEASISRQAGRVKLKAGASCRACVRRSPVRQALPSCSRRRTTKVSADIWPVTVLPWSEKSMLTAKLVPPGEVSVVVEPLPPNSFVS